MAGDRLQVVQGRHGLEHGLSAVTAQQASLLGGGRRIPVPLVLEAVGNVCIQPSPDRGLLGVGLGFA
jgi:hypothetical protein